MRSTASPVNPQELKASLVNTLSKQIADWRLLVYVTGTIVKESSGLEISSARFLQGETEMIRDTFASALKEAMKAKDTLRLSTVRLVQTAIKDRDIANRGVGKEPVSDEEILQILAKMIKQREESAGIYEKAGRDELAKQERDEIAIIKSFMPEEIPEAEVRGIIEGVIAETEALGLRDMGKVMAVLKERYPGRIDFGKASAQIKDLLK